MLEETQVDIVTISVRLIRSYPLEGFSMIESFRFYCTSGQNDKQFINRGIEWEKHAGVISVEYI